MAYLVDVKILRIKVTKFEVLMSNNSIQTK